MRRPRPAQAIGSYVRYRTERQLRRRKTGALDCL